MTTNPITLTPRVKAALTAGDTETLAMLLATWPPEELRLLHQELRDSYAAARQELDDYYIRGCQEFDHLLNEAGRKVAADHHSEMRAKLAEMFIEIENVVKEAAKRFPQDDTEKTA